MSTRRIDGWLSSFGPLVEQWHRNGSQSRTWRDTVLAACAVVLSQYSRQTSVTFSPIDADGWRPLVIDLSDDPPFQQLVSRVAEARALVDGAGDGDVSGYAIDPRLLIVAHLVRPSAVRAEGADAFPLVLVIGVERVWFEHEVEAVSQESVSVLASQLRQAVMNAVVRSDTRASSIDVLAPEDRVLLDQWNRTEQDIGTRCIHELFEEQVALAPDAIAVICGDDRLTRRELNERANRVAHRLTADLVYPEPLVGLCTDESIAGVIGALAILKAGGAYVPLNPDHPPDRLLTQISDTRLSIVVTTLEARARLAHAPVRCVCVDDVIVDAATADGNPGRATSLDHAAYVIYTSGSTGEPKGVIGIHRSVVNGLPVALFDARRHDEVACLNTPLSIGFSLLAMFLPLMAGVPLVVFRREETTDVSRCLSVLQTHKITNLAVPPHLLRELLQLAAQQRDPLPHLRTVMVGGAPLGDDVMAACRRVLPQATLCNGYGSMEIGSIATKGVVGVGPSSTGVTVGRPIVNTRVYVLDSRLREVPIGMVGEMFIGAPHISRGYLNHPGLTAERFLASPFRAGERLYRSGDLGRLRRKGEFELVGRADQQLKIRGFRVEPEEVERVLELHPAVRTAAVSAQRIGADDRLVAHIVTREQSQVRVAELRQHAQARLPDFMVPSLFLFATELARSSGGKIDRRALQVPAAVGRPDISAEYVEPRNPLESALAAMWAAEFCLDRIGVRDDFLELGGDSMLAARLSLQLLAQFGIEVAPAVILASGTIEELAAHMYDEAPVNDVTHQ